MTKPAKGYVSAVRLHGVGAAQARNVASHLLGGRLALGPVIVAPESVTVGRPIGAGRWERIGRTREGTIEAWVFPRAPNGIAIWVVPLAEVIAGAAFLGSSLVKLSKVGRT